jgi:hypothetical protein
MEGKAMINPHLRGLKPAFAQMFGRVHEVA